MRDSITQRLYGQVLRRQGVPVALIPLDDIKANEKTRLNTSPQGGGSYDVDWVTWMRFYAALSGDRCIYLNSIQRPK